MSHFFIAFFISFFEGENFASSKFRSRIGRRAQPHLHEPSGSMIGPGVVNSARSGQKYVYDPSKTGGSASAFLIKTAGHAAQAAAPAQSLMKSLRSIPISHLPGSEFVLTMFSAVRTYIEA